MISQHSRQNISCGSSVQTPWDCSVLWFEVGFDLWMRMIRKYLLKPLFWSNLKQLCANTKFQLLSPFAALWTLMTYCWQFFTCNRCLSLCSFDHFDSFKKSIWDYSVLLAIQSPHLQVCCGRQSMKEFLYKTKYKPRSRRQFDHQSYCFWWSVKKEECNSKSH